MLGCIRCDPEPSVQPIAVARITMMPPCTLGALQEKSMSMVVGKHAPDFHMDAVHNGQFKALSAAHIRPLWASFAIKTPMN